MYSVLSPVRKLLLLLSLIALHHPHVVKGAREDISGQITLVNCKPDVAEDVYVVLRASNESLRFNASGSVVPQANGLLVLSFSADVPPDFELAGHFLVIPNLPTRCLLGVGGGQWTPRVYNVSYSSLPLSSTDFLFTAGVSVDLNELLDGLVESNRFELLLTSYDGHGGLAQNSYLYFNSVYIPVPAIPLVNIDLDVCSSWFCPDVGDATYFVNNLQTRDFSVKLVNDVLYAELVFDDAPAGLKGIYHPGRIDSIAPDFGLYNMKVTSKVAFKTTSHFPGLTIALEEVRLTASIESGGICKIFGFNLCDYFYEAEAYILGALDSAAKQALSAGTLDSYFLDAIASLLDQSDLYVDGFDIMITDCTIFRGKLYALVDLQLDSFSRRLMRSRRFRQRH